MTKLLKYIFSYALLVFLLTSCFKEDEAILLSPLSGNIDTLKLNIENYFSYFDFETESFVHHLNATSWELGLESTPEGYNITVNSGADWFIGRTNETEFNIISGVNQDLNWKWDNQKFYPDSTAVGSWLTINNSDTTYSNKIYILSNFVDGSYEAKYELTFLNVSTKSYSIAISSTESSTIDTVIIHKTPDKALVYYSLTEKTIVNEPNKDAYDILFGPYYEGLDYNLIVVPYLVRGALLNPYLTQVCVDSISNFNDIGIQHIDDYKFSDTRNYIGYEWKQPIIDFDSGKAVYKVRTDYNFVIRTSSGAYYKFRFLNYAVNGENGFPSFQYMKLEYPDV